MFISGRECLTSLMNLCAKDAPLSQEMPTDLPSHDKRQCLHRQAHGTHKFCIMSDPVIILFGIPLYLGRQSVSVVCKMQPLRIPAHLLFLSISPFLRPL